MLRRLTELELKSLSRADAGRKLRDGDGVTGVARARVDGSIAVDFTLRYRSDGRTREVHLGNWPAASLRAIRAERDRVRGLVRERRDPADARQAARLKDRADLIEQKRRLAEEEARTEFERKQDRTVRQLFTAWLAGSGRKAPRRKGDNAELRRSFEFSVLPVIGDRALRGLSSDDVKALLRSIGAERGRNRLAIVALRDLTQMIAWALEEREWRDLLPDGNVAGKVAMIDIVQPTYDLAGMSQRVLSAEEIVDLRDRLVRLDRDWLTAPDRRACRQPIKPTTQIALWLVLSTTCRIGELLMAEWGHVDLERGEWVIPKANYKHKPGDPRPDYLILLSRFAIRHFAALKELTGTGRWCFPSGRSGKAGPPGGTHVELKSVAKQIADRQASTKMRRTKRPAGRVADDSLLLAGGGWSTHDLRRSGSTLMSRLKVDRDVRNLCLNHVTGSKIDRVYNVHDFREEKADAWARLGAELDRILGTPADDAVEPAEREAA